MCTLVHYIVSEQKDTKMKKLYQVVELEDNGFHIRSVVCIVSANTGDEARVKAAKYKHNREIVSTGFYEAREITQEKLTADIELLQQEIQHAILLLYRLLPFSRHGSKRQGLLQ